VGLSGANEFAERPAPEGVAADMAAKCQAMMADQEKMMTEMKAADQRLNDLVVKMNAAAGMQKAEAAAAVVNEMVIQRRAMPGGMMKMQHGKMAHMQAKTSWKCVP
jgi:Skp family chaperone for outer membrane proteins